MLNFSILNTTAPTISSVSAPAGDYGAGKALTLTLNMSEAVTVSGTPTLALNDGGTATYASGSGTNTLKFNYTVASGQNTSALAVTAVNGTIADLAGNPLSTTGLPEIFSGVTISTKSHGLALPDAPPVVTQVAASPSSGTEFPGDVITIAVDLNQSVMVLGTPSLTLNDGGTATYITGSGTNVLTFGYTVGANDTTVSALAIARVNLPNGATVTNAAGTEADLTGALTTFSGLGIDPPSSGSLGSSIAQQNQNGSLIDTPGLALAHRVAASSNAADLSDRSTAVTSLAINAPTLSAGGEPTNYSGIDPAGPQTTLPHVAALLANYMVSTFTPLPYHDNGNQLADLSGTLSGQTTFLTHPVANQALHA